ncbi:MAG: hypothetical protein H6747_07940 [Deltaproteobacteria bacterium]|nr:hypothetical protein [Deltaproteobacteria bacterium]
MDVTAYDSQFWALRADGQILTWGKNAVGANWSNGAKILPTPIPIGVVPTGGKPLRIKVPCGLEHKVYVLDDQEKLYSGTIQSNGTIKFQTSLAGVVGFASGVAAALTKGQPVALCDTNNYKKLIDVIPDAVDLATGSGVFAITSSGKLLRAWQISENPVAVAVVDSVPAKPLRFGSGQLYTSDGNLYALEASGIKQKWGPQATGAVDFAGYCHVTLAGEVKCWGDNAFGERGSSASLATDTLAKVEGITDAVRLAATDGAICALRGTGDVLCFGNNRYGQLGDGSAQEKHVVTKLSGGIVGAKFVDGQPTCVKASTGKVYCWGMKSPYSGANEPYLRQPTELKEFEGVDGWHGNLSAWSGTGSSCFALARGGGKLKSIRASGLVAETKLSTVLQIGGMMPRGRLVLDSGGQLWAACVLQTGATWTSIMSGVAAVDGECIRTSSGSLKCWGDGGTTYCTNCNAGTCKDCFRSIGILGSGVTQVAQVASEIYLPGNQGTGIYALSQTGSVYLAKHESGNSWNVTFVATGLPIVALGHVPTQAASSASIDKLTAVAMRNDGTWMQLSGNGPGNLPSDAASIGKLSGLKQLWTSPAVGCGLDATGAPHCWGDNRCANGIGTCLSPSPVKVALPPRLAGP